MDFAQFSEELNINIKTIDIFLNAKQIENFYKYMEMLIEKNKVMNLTAITDPKEIIIKHFMDSLTVARYLKGKNEVIDIGTGAGFPGIPLKIYNTSIEMCLLDSLNKRISFLNEVINTIDLEKIVAIHGRAEEYGQNLQYRERFDVAVSRAVAPLNVLLEYMLPFVHVGGQCLCMKGNISEEELQNAKNALNILGGEIEKIEKFTLPNTDYNRTIIIVKKTRKTPDKYPRKAGMPSNTPL